MAENYKNRVRHYESVFILSPSLSEAQTKEVTDKVTKTVEDFDGQTLRLDDWGKCRMAYEMEKHAMGHYFYLRFIGSEALLKALERNFKLDVAVIRYLSVRLSDPLSKTQIQVLLEKAPKEQTSLPGLRDDDDFSPEVISYS